MNRTRKYKNSMVQRAYDRYRYAPRTRDGLIGTHPITGTGLRATYWNGRAGIGTVYPHLLPQRNSIAYGIYMAGYDRQEELDGYHLVDETLV